MEPQPARAGGGRPPRIRLDRQRAAHRNRAVRPHGPVHGLHGLPRASLLRVEYRGRRAARAARLEHRLSRRTPENWTSTVDRVEHRPVTYWAQLLHFYQPPTQTHDVLQRV